MVWNRLLSPFKRRPIVAILLTVFGILVILYSLWNWRIDQNPNSPIFTTHTPFVNGAKLSKANPLYTKITRLFYDHIEDPILSIEDRSKGCDQKVYLITCQGTSYVLKTAEDPVKITSEVRGTEIAKKLGIPAPEVLYHQPHYLIETPIAGTDLESTAEVPIDIYFEIGRALKKLHSVKQSYYGEVGREKFTTLRDHIASYHTEALSNLLQSKWLTPAQCSQIRAYFTSHAHYLFSEQACLLHGDIADDNVMSDGAQLTGIIDWADLTAGVPEEEFACARASMKPQNYASLVRGYGGIDQRKVDYFTAIRLTWMLEGKAEEKQLQDPKDLARMQLYMSIIDQADNHAKLIAK